MLDLNVVSSSLEKAQLTDNLFNVHSVLLIIWTQPEKTDLEKETIALGSCSWIAYSWTRVKVSNGYRYSALCYPKAIDRFVEQSTVDAASLRSMAALKPNRSYSENIPFRTPVTGLDLSSLLFRYRLQEFEYLTTADTEYRSRRNLFLYVKDDSLISARYSTLFAGAQTLDPSKFNTAGAAIAYTNKKKLNFYLGRGSFTDRKRTFRLHQMTYFDETLQIRTDFVLEPFKTYNLRFSEDTAPSGNYCVYRALEDWRMNPRFTYLLGKV